VANVPGKRFSRVKATAQTTAAATRLDRHSAPTANRHATSHAAITTPSNAPSAFGQGSATTANATQAQPSKRNHRPAWAPRA